jgi:aryl-alcohol dehydrogenase-like predicted oxidoreductase
MRYGHIPGQDKPIARLVQGTVMLSSSRLEESFQLLDDVFAQGGTTFDAAHGYGQGDCERTLGRWIEERGIREQVVILTKGAHHNQDRRRVTPFDITADLHDSLARLRTDHVDLYVLHRDDPAVPVGPIVEILNEHHAAGRIGAFGGSNWSHTRIQAANDYAAAHGLLPFAISSPHFSLAIQVQEPWENCISLTGPGQAAARRYYQERQIPLFTWSSLAGGFFSGRFQRDNLDSFTTYLDKLCVQSYGYEENFQRLERAQQAAAQFGCSVPQVALAYVLNQPWDIYTLIGCANGREFADNAAALELPLTPSIRHWLEEGGERPF